MQKARRGSLGHDHHYHNFFSMLANEGNTECVGEVCVRASGPNNRRGETGGGRRVAARGQKGTIRYLCEKLSRGVQLNELPVLVALVSHNSRFSLFPSGPCYFLSSTSVP